MEEAQALGTVFATMLVVGATLLIVLIAMLIFREIVCWYWKINESVALLRNIEAILRAQAGDLVVPEQPPGPGARSEPLP